MRWSLERGFVYVRYYERFVQDASYGDVVVSGSGVTFVVKRDIRSTFGPTPRKWFPALGGRYFIPRDDLQMFVNYYGGFGDFNGFPRKWNCDCEPFAARITPERDLKNKSNFIVPAALQRFIKAPIVGKITKMGKRYYGKHPVPYSLDEMDRKASLTPVTINVGRLKGVSAGLLFLLSPNTDGAQEVLMVSKASDRNSTGLVIRTTDRTGREAFVESYNDAGEPIYKNYQPIRPGTVIRTRDLKSL